MLPFLIKRWFLIGLLAFIPGGFCIGYWLGPDRVEAISTSFAATASKVDVFLVLFLMSWTLDSSKLMASIRSPGPVLWASVVNSALLPLLALVAMRWQLQRDFAVGLLVAGTVPCTMAAASVLTRKAHGNDAVSLLVTILTSSLCFLVVPFWLGIGIGDSVQFDMRILMMNLLVSALLPIIVGQLCRIPTPLREFATSHRIPLGVVAQSAILLMVLWASIQGGPHLAAKGAAAVALNPIAIAVVWITAIALHLVGFSIAYSGAKLLRFPQADWIAVGISGSQKTLPIGVYLATDLLSNQGLPFAVFPMLMYHVSQLFLDTLLIDLLARNEPTVKVEKVDAGPRAETGSQGPR